SGNTPALGPAAEELKLLTIFIDGCTDFLFDKAVPNPRYVFRITNIQSADGSTCALAVAMTWPDVKKVAHIHPDYAYGRNCFDHFSIVTKKLMPGAQNVSEAWPKLFSTDFTPHITKTLAAQQELRGEVLREVQRVPELPGGGSLHRDPRPADRGGEGEQAGRRLARRRRDHLPDRGHDDRGARRVRLHPPGQSPGLQG